ncbi:hypothetical protein ACQKIE_04730 [Luteibacter sp. NPDC031894]|uniref:hypothetical protein n=1 Tax=Luteibacter sp. NPDC031894 TaxID=3390572 RepID=UPI003D0113AB
MAAPWEDTIVMALRDAQWLKDEPGSVPHLPPMFVKLDGTTEQSLGDLIYQAGERFYLFEVKSAAAAIASEWNKTVDGKPRPKLAYRTLSRLARAVATPRPSIEDHEAFWTSLRCHHLVYWSDAMFNIDDTMGNILVEPYIGACVRRGAPRGTGPLEMPSLAIQTAVDGATNDLLVAPMAPLSAVRAQQATVLIHDGQGGLNPAHMAAFGEDLERFRAYLQFLVKAGGAGDGAIHAVICSDRGRFTKLISSVDQLARELRPTSSADPKPPQVLKRNVYPRPSLVSSMAHRSAPAVRPAFPDFSPPAPRPRPLTPGRP